MVDSYLARLPADLVDELAMWLPLSQLMDATTHLPTFSRFNDPNHHVWRDLCRRDLTTTPSNSAQSYREQYVSIHNPDIKPYQLGIDYIRQGYELAFISAYFSNACCYNQMKIILDLLQHHEATILSTLTYSITCHDTAAKGHDTMLEMLLELPIQYGPRVNWVPDYDYILMGAVTSGNADLVKRLFSLKPEPITAHLLTSLLINAVEVPFVSNLETIRYLIGLYTSPVPYGEIWFRAIYGRIDTLDCLFEMGAVVTHEALFMGVQLNKTGLHEWLIENTPADVYQDCYVSILAMCPTERLQLHLDHQPLDGSVLLSVIKIRLPDLDRLKLLIHHPNTKLHRGHIEDLLETDWPIWILEQRSRLEVVIQYFKALSSVM